jgi:hypothetical protein
MTPQELQRVPNLDCSSSTGVSRSAVKSQLLSAPQLLPDRQLVSTAPILGQKEPETIDLTEKIKQLTA